jgi:hypothetical protein
VQSKYQKNIEGIRRGAYSREQLVKLRANAVALVTKGEDEAKRVVEEIDRATPTDKEIVFMGFCPGADFENRMDLDWKKKGVCTFVFWESDQQRERFENIWPGDLIVLKKRHQFGKTMLLYGHGRVVGVKYDNEGRRFLEMKWSDQEEIIEVPLMACNSTVDVRSIEKVEGAMPAEFFTWLGDSKK